VETANPHQPETDGQKEADVEGKNEIVLAERIGPTKTALRMPKFDGLQELCIDRMLADTSPDWQDQTQRICLQVYILPMMHLRLGSEIYGFR
jgi:hypothetical protein